VDRNDCPVGQDDERTVCQQQQQQQQLSCSVTSGRRGGTRPLFFVLISIHTHLSREIAKIQFKKNISYI
jgi:hypothetical protein